jgi:hypothetical protein
MLYVQLFNSCLRLEKGTRRFKSLVVKVNYTHRKKAKSSSKAKNRAPPIRKVRKDQNSYILSKDISNDQQNKGKNSEFEQYSDQKQGCKL